MSWNKGSKSAIQETDFKFIGFQLDRREFMQELGITI